VSTQPPPPTLVQSDNFLQQLGRALMIAMHAASQSLRIYPTENATVQKSLDEVYRLLRRLLDREEAVELRAVGDFLFLNGGRLRLDLSDYAAFSYMIRAMGRHGIGRIDFHSDMQRQDLVPLLSLLLQDGEGDEDAFEDFHERLTPAVGENIVVEAVRGSDARRTRTKTTARSRRRK
jgi:hypothetical protein